MMKKPSVFIAAGGTGGHVFPALAVASEFIRRDVDVVFIGTGKDIEQKLLEGIPCRYEIVEFTPISGKGLMGILKAFVKFPCSILKALRLIRRYQPQAIIGFGGYPSVIPVIAAFIKGVNVFLQEQNVKVGLANKVLSCFCKKIFAAHGASGFWNAKHIRYISNPVRDEFFAISKWQRPQQGERLVILIVGGSQGAVAINHAVIDVLGLLAKFEVKVVHQTGDADYDRCYQAYQGSDIKHWKTLRFINDIASEYSRAHIVICRAGAMTVAEVVAAARPAIFIPLNIAGGHQHLNAKWVVDAGGAMTIWQTQSLAKDLGDALVKTLEHPELIEEMAFSLEKLKQDQGEPSAKVICDEILFGYPKNGSGRFG